MGLQTPANVKRISKLMQVGRTFKPKYQEDKRKTAIKSDQVLAILVLEAFQVLSTCVPFGKKVTTKYIDWILDKGDPKLKAHWKKWQKDTEYIPRPTLSGVGQATAAVETGLKVLEYAEKGYDMIQVATGEKKPKSNDPFKDPKGYYNDNVKDKILPKVGGWLKSRINMNGYE